MGPRESLNDYLKSVSDKPFVWGQHDCLTFTNGAYKLCMAVAGLMTGLVVI